MRTAEARLRYPLGLGRMGLGRHVDDGVFLGVRVDVLAVVGVVLLVSGGHDEVRPHLTAAMHERLRHGERVVFEDSSHMPHIEEPERFLAVVEGFLERSEAA